jgi:shikimate dehydrogenase
MDMKIDSRTHLYGIFGNPVDHSLSPQLHNPVFKKLGMDAVYLAFKIEQGSLGLAFEGMRSLGIRGVNVTIPFKEDVVNFLDEIPEDLDRLTGAINTVVLKDGELLGYNTDGPGFLVSLQEDLKFRAEGKDILILGAGGSARGILFALARAGADRIFIHNRTHERAHGLAEYAAQYFPETEIQPIASFEDLPSNKKMDLIVNTTPCGMKGDTDLPLDWGLVKEPGAAYDIVYSPKETPWLKEAKRLGIPCANGLGMLVEQAALSFSLWTGKKDGVREAMREAVAACRL